MIHFVLGGARSGKSSFAERLAKQLAGTNPAKRLHYVATAIPFDDEMRARISHHQQNRGEDWTEYESPYQLAEALQRFTFEDVVLVDCLILWLNNVIYNHGEPCELHHVQQKLSGLIDRLQAMEAEIILVSNEVGMGIVPEGNVSQMFVDFAGIMNQMVTTVASNVILVAAGMPVWLKTPDC